MIDYKKFLQVKKILEADLRKDLTGGSAESDFVEPTIEDRASAICELFDQKTTQTATQGVGGFVKPMTIQAPLQNTPSTTPCGQFPRDAFGAPIPY